MNSAKMESVSSIEWTRPPASRTPDATSRGGESLVPFGSPPTKPRGFVMAGNCGTCFFSRPTLSVTGVSCCRYPPTITRVDDNNMTTHFPIVALTAWCGEYNPKLDTAVSVSDMTIPREDHQDESVPRKVRRLLTRNSRTRGRGR